MKVVPKFLSSTTYFVSRYRKHLFVPFLLGTLFGCDGVSDTNPPQLNQQSLLADHHDVNTLQRSIAMATGSGNLLTNPGFESGLSGWDTCNSNTAAQLTADSSAGRNAVEIGARNCLQQVLRLPVGVEYELACDARKVSNSGWTGMGISYYDESLAFIDEAVDRVNGLNYQNYTATLSAPNNTYLSLVWLYTTEGAILDNCSLSSEGQQPPPQVDSLLSYSRSEKFIERDSKDDIVFNDRFDGNLQVRVGTSNDAVKNAVYVSQRNGSESWTITAPDYEILSVDVSDNRLVIGAGQNLSPYETSIDGAALIYDLIDGNWVRQATVTLPSSVSNPTDTLNERINFGQSVAISGDTLVVGAARREVGVVSSGLKGAEVTVFEFDGSAWNSVFQDDRNHIIWQNMDPTRWYEPYVEISGNRAVMSHILGAILYVRENGVWSIADIEHSYSFVGRSGEEDLLKSGPGYLVYSHDEGVNALYDPSLRFIGNQLRVYHHELESNVCPVSLAFGCSAPAPIHIFDFDNEPLETQGSKAVLTRLNVWNEAALDWIRTIGKGYIATYSCTLQNDAPNGVVIDFNYKGPGTSLSSWMNTYIGDVVPGNTGPGGSYALNPSSNIRSFVAGDTIEFEFLANDVAFIDSDFNTRCIPL